MNNENRESKTKGADDGGEWTLYDNERHVVWGGRFRTEGAARRWRQNAELPAAIVPMLADEARAKAESR
jgi:hypothetical protein